MLGFVSLKQQKIYLPDREVSFSDKDFANPNLLAEFVNVNLWLCDSNENKNYQTFKWITPYSPPPLIIPEWDSFSFINKLSYPQIVQALSALPVFYPEITQVKDKFKELWKFEYREQICELPEQVKISSSNKTFDIQLDIVDFYLWLFQQDVIVPKGNCTPSRRTFKSLLDDTSINLGVFVKKENIIRFFKKIPLVASTHWQSEWIAASWLKMIVHDEILGNTEFEVDTLEYEEVQPVKSLLPQNFDLTWLFCPSAHTILFRYHKYLNETKSELSRLFYLLVGNFIFYRLTKLADPTMTAEFHLWQWRTVQMKNSFGFANKYRK